MRNNREKEKGVSGHLWSVGLTLTQDKMRELLKIQPSSFLDDHGAKIAPYRKFPQSKFVTFPLRIAGSLAHT